MENIVSAEKALSVDLGSWKKCRMWVLMMTTTVGGGGRPSRFSDLVNSDVTSFLALNSDFQAKWNSP